MCKYMCIHICVYIYIYIYIYICIHIQETLAKDNPLPSWSEQVRAQFHSAKLLNDALPSYILFESGYELTSGLFALFDFILE